ncbi:hypothetical protein [uncultured Enterococcus sp.]|uniref:hypothetical protein n=1 Tax=uncultured Enterococcus sp. TaxID=167972 RepID=UPI002AA64E02|nr:hypothetical protein [uncultured Enterococcus sp.]
MSKFRHYLQRLQQLNEAETLVKGQKVVLFISGSSHFEHAELSEYQRSFFSWSLNQSSDWLPMNFPYNEGFVNSNPVFPALLQASWSNCLYFLHTRWNKAFQRELVRHLTPVFQCEEVIIISQSSGLNMLTTILPNIDSRYKKLNIIALGPVSLKKINKEKYPCTVIKGKKDLYSRLLDRHQPDYLVESTHFDYLMSLEVREIVNDCIRKN